MGDVVHAGDTLATLDPTFTAADVAQLRERLDSYAAQIARIEAEMAGRDYAAPAAATPHEVLQAAVFLQRRAYHQAQLRTLDERIARGEAGLATNRRDQEGLTARLEVLREVEAMRQSLLATQTGSRLNLLEARSARLEAERSLALLANTLVEIRHELAGARAERDALVQDFRQKALEELVGLRREHDSLAEQLNKAERRRAMVALTAPADAVVLEVAPRSIGSVLREAEPLFTLVPLDVPIEAEVSIAAQDIGPVVPGAAVRVKLEAFPFQKHGTADGIVRTISGDAFTRPPEAGGGTVYRARVRLTGTGLRGVPDTFRLIPGMTVAAEIKVGRRSVLSYFLYPLLRGLDESIREP